MQYEIAGTTMPALTLKLAPGERVYAEAGAMAWMTESIEMDSTIRGGLFGALGRMLTGESLALTAFSTRRQPGEVTFTGAVPGRIIPVPVERGQDIIVQATGLLCLEEGVEMKLHFRRKLWSGLFGGEGFLLQRLSGNGLAFCEIDGEVVEKELGRGEMLRVDPGHIAMFDESVTFDISMVRGIKNWFLGGEGLFLATLEGPGRVWLQTLPFSNLVGMISACLPSRSGWRIDT